MGLEGRRVDQDVLLIERPLQPRALQLAAFPAAGQDPADGCHEAHLGPASGKLCERSFDVDSFFDSALSPGGSQEDELATCQLSGGLSPYMSIVLPSKHGHFSRFLDFKDATVAERQLWLKKFLYFLRKASSGGITAVGVCSSLGLCARVCS